MRWTHARMLILAGVLIQGAFASRAKQPDFSDRFALVDRTGLFMSESEDLSHSVRSYSSKQKTLDLLITKKSSAKKNFSYIELPSTVSEVKVKELRPLTIGEIEQLVEMNNPSLKVAALKIEQERSKLLSVIASWYPTVDFTANGLPQYLMADSYSNRDYSSTPNTRSSQWKTQFSAKVQWNIIDPARVPQIAAARDSYERARDSYLISLRDIRLQATVKFLELQRADQGVIIGKKSLKSSRLSKKDADARFESGVSSKFETLEAETQLARDLRLLNNALRDQELARRSLAELINLDQDIIPISSQSISPLGLWDSSLEESIIAAYNFREELDRYLLDISINHSKANEALAASQPIVSLFNTFSTSRTQGQINVVEPNNKDYGWTASNTVGLSATWKIFDGGSAKSLYRLNKQRAREQEINFIAERNKIKNEVEQSYFNLIAARQALASTRDEITAQTEVLRLARLRFNAGISNQREILENQRDLRQAEINYADAIASYNTNLVELRRRTGLDEIKQCNDINQMLPNDVTKGDNNPNSLIRELDLLCRKPLFAESE